MRVRDLLLLLAALPAVAPSKARTITTPIVEIRTLEARCAGTDDAMHLQFGGRDFPLDIRVATTSSGTISPDSTST